MSDFGKGVAFGWLTSGNGNSGGGDGDGCLDMIKGILAIIAFLIVGFIIVYIIAFFLVLKDMGILWYIGLPFFLGLWDLYLPLELSAGQKLWMFTIEIIVFWVINHLYEEHIQYYFNPSDKPRPFKKLRNLVLNVFNFSLVVCMFLGLFGAILLIPRTIYYLFVVVF